MAFFNSDKTQFGYDYDRTHHSWTRALAEKTKGYLYGYGDSEIRKALMNSNNLYQPGLVGAAVQYALDFTYGLFLRGGVSANYHPDVDDADDLSHMTPMMSKEIFINTFHNEFVNNNRFYVEFIRTKTGSDSTNNSVNLRNEVPAENLTPRDYNVLSRRDVNFVKSSNETARGTYTNNTDITEPKNYQILLNYMVDSVQFPNFTSKKATISRFGQDLTFINNQHYDPHLTINFTYDMRGNIDRFLHYMAEYSKYFNNTRENKFQIRITSYKSMHHLGNNDNPVLNNHVPSTYNEFKINTKTFYNVQLDSMQNYSLDNKQGDFLSRAVMFTFQGLEEESFDNSNHDLSLSELASMTYNMYNNTYEWLKTNNDTKEVINSSEKGK